LKYSVINLVLNNFENDSRVLKISKSLKQAGHEVQVIALHEESLPIRDDSNGIDVHRIVLSSRNWPRKKFFQLFKYLEFTFRVLMRYRNHDIYYCNDLHTLPLGVMLKLFSGKRTKILYDAHEYESEANGLSKLEKTFRRWLERLLISFAETTVTVSNSIADEYVRLYGIEKPAVLLNVPPLSSVTRHDLFREELEIATDKTIYLYQGVLSPGRGIEVLLDAFEQLGDSGRVIVFMGYGPLDDLVRSRAESSDNIFFREAVSASELPRYTSSADVGISTIENSCLSYYYCLPNKLFEYLMAEIPVIVSNLYEMRSLVKEYELGVVAEENTVAGIKQAVVEMDEFHLEGFQVNIKPFKSRFNWEAQEELLIGLFNEIERKPG